MKKGLGVISNQTLRLWYKVNEKYGDHVYMLGVNGLDQVVLSIGYGEDVAIGNGAVQAKLRELLKKKG